MLTTDESHFYRQLLVQRLQQIEMQFDQLKEIARSVSPDPSTGRLTQDAMQQQQLTLESRRRLELQQTQIATALNRIEKGIFGICVLCKNPIPADRLKLLPESPLCVTCLEKSNARTV